MPKVSIIIPVYNAEAFLDETIASLLNQELTDCEFIFVNDGSTDGSVEVLQKYTANNTRIVLLSQVNQGISIARNAGLAIAKGDYVGFMDNDDYIKPDMYRLLYTEAVANNLDITVSKTILGRDGKYIIKDSVFPPGIVYDNIYIQQHIIHNLLKCEDMFAVWNKLYKRSFIEQYGVKFPANRNIEEDSMFNFKAFNKAARVTFIDYSGYYYRDVAVNESRKFIQRDYFIRAVERYRFDYKKEIGLPTDDSDVARLTAIRFIHRVFYLIFRCATDRQDSKKVRYNYIKNMVTSPIVQEAAAKYTKEELEVRGYFETVLFTIIKKQSVFALAVIVKMLQVLYTPKTSELLRRINKTKTGTTQE